MMFFSRKNNKSLLEMLVPTRSAGKNQAVLEKLNNSIKIQISIEEDPSEMGATKDVRNESGGDKKDNSSTVVPDEKSFRIINGPVLKSINDLYRYLHEVDEYQFIHHTQHRKENDFANWIFHVFGHVMCAAEIDRSKTPQEMIEVLNRYFHITSQDNPQ